MTARFGNSYEGRQGRCDRCKIRWVWQTSAGGPALTAARCPECLGDLRRTAYLAKSLAERRAAADAMRKPQAAP